MAENRLAEPGSGIAPEHRERDASEGPPPECFGPLELRRLSKEDGRALIAYARPAREEPR